VTTAQILAIAMRVAAIAAVIGVIVGRIRAMRRREPPRDAPGP
jgi:hypothetical protein